MAPDRSEIGQWHREGQLREPFRPFLSRDAERSTAARSLFLSKQVKQTTTQEVVRKSDPLTRASGAFIRRFFSSQSHSYGESAFSGIFVFPSSAGDKSTHARGDISFQIPATMASTPCTSAEIKEGVSGRVRLLF